MAEIDSNYKYLTYEEMGKNLAERALDDVLYDGKSIREWMQIIASEDAISRQAVLDEIDDTNRRGGFGCKLSYTRCRGHIELLPPVNPQKNIVNNGTMNITL